MASKYKQSLAGRLITKGNNILSKLIVAQNIDDLSSIVNDFFYWREDIKEYVNTEADISDPLRAYFFKPSKVLANGLTLGESFTGIRAEKVKIFLENEITEINKTLSSVNDKKKVKYESYDSKTRTMVIGDMSCNIGVKPDSDHALLMKYLAKAPRKTLGAGDILEKIYGIDPVRDKERFKEALTKNKVYFAGKKITEEVERKLHLPSFLLVSEKSIQINPIYL